MMKVVNFRLDETKAQRYALIYGNTSAGVTFAANGFLSLRPFETRWLRGIFAKNELLAIIDILKDYAFEPELMANTQHLFIQLEDGYKYGNTAEKVLVDMPSLLNKLKALSPASLFFLQDAIKELHFNKTQSIDDFIKEMTNS